MPAAIPFIIQAVGYYLGANAIVVAVVVLAASYAVSNYQKRKAQRASRDAYNASLEDRLVMQALSNGARSITFGRVRNTDGIVFKGTWGNNKEFFTLVVPIAGHEIDGHETIYFNDAPLELAGDGIPVSGGAVGGQGYFVKTEPFGKWSVESRNATMNVVAGSGTCVFEDVPINPTQVTAMFYQGSGVDDLVIPVTVNTVTKTGSVTGAPQDGQWLVAYQYNALTPKARVWLYNGAAGQDLSPLLQPRFPALLTSADKFTNMACIVVEFTYDQDSYPNGIPSVTSVHRGMRILDTRTGVTAWSQNPAMIARTWLLHKNGGGFEQSDLDAASFNAAANACDTSTVFTTTSGTETRPLFQCGIVCKTDLSPEDHFGEMVEAMGGKFGFSGGLMRVVAGVWRAPVMALDETFLSGKKSVIVTKSSSKQQRVNNFRPTISNADGYVDGVTGPKTSVAYTATPLPAVRSSTYIALDGQELTQEISMLGVTRAVHAAHICGIQMRDMRESMIVQICCNLKAWPLELFDNVTLTLAMFGFAAKQFEVLGRKYNVEEGIYLTLKETAPAIYDVGAGLDIPDLSINTTLPLPWVVPPITGLTLTSNPSVLQDGYPTTRTRISWNPTTSEAVAQSGKIEIQYILGYTSSLPEDWTTISEQGNSTSTVVAGLQAGRAYIFRIRAANTLGVRSAWSSQIVYIVTDPPPLDTDGIAPGAATQIYNGAVDATTYSNSTGSATPGLVIVTASATCEAIVTVTMNAGSDMQTWPTATRAAVVLDAEVRNVTDGITIPGENGGFYRKPMAANEIWSFQHTQSFRVNVVKGKTYHFYGRMSGFIYSSGIPSSTANLFSTQVRVELIKR